MTSIPFSRRPLDRAESFFWFLDRLSSMNFTVLAEGRGDLDDAALSGALAAAQRRHPLLRVAIEGDTEHRLHFAPRPPQGIDLVRLAGHPWTEALAQANVQPFALGEAPLVRAYRLNKEDGAWVLALVFHHAIADARSAFSLLTEILQGAAGLAVPTAAVAPQPPLLDLYPESYQGAAARAAGERLKAERKATLGAIGLPDPQAEHAASDEAPSPVLLPLCLAPAQAAALGQRARRERATVGGAIGAAQLIALRRLHGTPEERTLGLTCAADLRPYLKHPVDTATPGFYVTLVTTLQRVGDTDGFWDLARRLSNGIRQQLNGGTGHLLYHAVPSSAELPATEAGIQSFREHMARSLPTSLLSNAGQLTPLPELPGLTVEARSFALCPTHAQPVFTAVTGHAGGLSLNLNYNRKQLKDETAQAVFQSLEQLLRTACA